MRLRQAALVAEDLEPIAATLCDVFRVGAPFRDPGVEIFGLHNVVLPIGDTFLEVVAPLRADTAAGRYRDRQGGDGGYMLLLQSDDFDTDRARIDALGVRVVWSADLSDIRAMHLHPRDTGGTLLSIDQPRPAAAWRWGGPDWEKRGSALASGITAAEIRSPDPGALAARWSELLGRAAQSDGDRYRIALDRGSLRFRAAAAGEPERLVALDVAATDAEAVSARARGRGVLAADGGLAVGGIRIALV
jgi:hypothetical protein